MPPSAGQSAKDATEVAAEIVNGPYPELRGIPLAETVGLPNLGGARIELVSADHRGNPSVGQNQTLWLITEEKVAAMIGSYHSSVTLTATAVAERCGIPFLVADSAALNITQRAFKWTFRTTPIAPDFAKAYTAFLTELKTAGKTVNSIAVVNENTDYGTSVAASILDAANKAAFASPCTSPTARTDVSAQVLQLKAAQADAVIFVSYNADRILYMKTRKTLTTCRRSSSAMTPAFPTPHLFPRWATSPREL